MRETERVKIMKRMREKMRVRVRRREGLRETERAYGRPVWEIYKEKKIENEKKMAFVALNPLHLTIFRLLNSCRVSMDPRSRAFLMFAAYGMNEALELLLSLEVFRGRIESKGMEALRREIREAAWELENVLDYHVSAQFLSQVSETEKRPLLFSLNLKGMEQDIDVFVEKVMKMEKLLNPWLVDEEDGGGKESDIFGLSDQSEVDVIKTLFISWLPEEEEKEFKEWIKRDDKEEENGDGGKESDTFGISGESEVMVTRTLFISWFATKAASILLGKTEEFIQDLENLLPEEEEGDNYAVLSTIDRTTYFSRMVSSDRFRKIKGDLMIWWINKVSSIFVMETDYTQQLINPLPKDDAVVAVFSSEMESAVNMVGSTDLFGKIRDYILEDHDHFKVVSIVGMAGIGKTALTKNIIKDSSILSKFECCFFVRMGPECQWEEAMQAILAKMPDGDKTSVDYSVYSILKVRKYLIVLDDIWTLEYEDLLKVRGPSKSVILFTTRINENIISAHVLFEGGQYQVPFLNRDESWDLLCVKIFGERGCPPLLEKAGQTIAENCEGLPLLILAVAGLLSQAEETLENWSKVAANKTNSIFVEAYEQVLDVIYPSYHHLPQHIKACFLYLAAFPQNDDFRVSRLINLWSADGFLGIPYQSLQKQAYTSLETIVSHNVALGTQWGSIGHILRRTVKALSLHSVFWYLCKREARNEKFLHVLNSYRDASVEGVKSQRRLSIYKNAILIIKEARESIASITALQSLLCMGQYHQYQVSICLGLKLLKVLDALSIRFYEFPIEVLKLLQLRYLALTCNGNLPPSISILWGLQCLILHQHQSIRSSVSPSYLPVEIWDLQELEHLQIIGRNVPDPPPGAALRKLSTLLDVGAHTCTKRVLGSIPSLQKLRVQIELMPGVADPPTFCDDISHLQSLESLQFVVVNPELKFEAVARAPSFSFPEYLRKLTLSGFGYPWEYMSSLAALPWLKVLKLKSYAFRGEMWQVKEGEFVRLQYLSIEDTDLVQWTGAGVNFNRLEKLTIKNCYRLLQIPKLSGTYLRKIELVDCSSSAVTCAEQMTISGCSVHVESTWVAKKKLSYVVLLKSAWERYQSA